MIFTPTLTNKLDISNTDVFFSVVSFSTCGAAWLRESPEKSERTDKSTRPNRCQTPITLY